MTTEHENPDPESPETSEPPIYKRRWFPWAAGGTAVVLGLGIWAGVSASQEEPPEPEPTPSVAAPERPTTNPDPAASSNGDDSGAEESVEEPSTAQEQTQAEAQKAAETFMNKLNEGGEKEALAKRMSPYSTDALAASFEHVEEGAIPTDGETVSVSSGTEQWNAQVTNGDGEQLYSFVLNGYRNTDGEGTLLVESVDIPEDDDERRLDKNGYPIAPPVKPLSTDTLENLESQAYDVASYYFEFEHGESEEDRLDELEDRVRGGDIPDEVRPVIEGKDNDVQMFAPEGVRVMESANGDKVKDGQVSVAQVIKYADAAYATSEDNLPRPQEEVTVATDFTWSDATDSWAPSGFRVLSARPLSAEALEAQKD